MLNALKEKGLLLAVNSNKPQERTVNVVEKNFGKGTFDILVGQSDERARKPAPDGVFYIMEQLGLVREEVIYLGDTCVDMKTGKSAGVYTVGALWGFRDRQELEENHADAIIEHPMELFKYLYVLRAGPGKEADCFREKTKEALPWILLRLLEMKDFLNHRPFDP